MYGHGINPHTMHIYRQTLFPGRREGIGPSVTFRSPLLEEFRSDKARKWELQVKHINIPALDSCP